MADEKETKKKGKKADEKETKPSTPGNKLGGEKDEALDLSDEDVTSESGEIEMGEPMDIRPKSLPLVVKVPASASSAQKEYAKILNGYAYQNPDKYKAKKDILRKRLESLAGKEVSVSDDQRLSINKSSVSFPFIRDGKGNEYFAGTAPLSKE